MKEGQSVVCLCKRGWTINNQNVDFGPKYGEILTVLADSEGQKEIILKEYPEYSFPSNLFREYLTPHKGMEVLKAILKDPNFPILNDQFDISNSRERRRLI